MRLRRGGDEFVGVEITDVLEDSGGRGPRNKIGGGKGSFWPRSDGGGHVAAYELLTASGVEERGGKGDDEVLVGDAGGAVVEVEGGRCRMDQGG